MAIESSISAEQSLEVAKFLAESGYGMADDTNIRTDSMQSLILEGVILSNIGILKPKKDKKYFWILKEIQRADLIGRLHFNIAPDQWLLTVYGRENVEELSRLGGNLGNKFEREVQVRLTREHPDEERWLCDHG